MSFIRKGEVVTLQGLLPEECALTLVSLSATEPQLIPADIQQLLNRFTHVFTTPEGLPPRCCYDHTIPLIPGA